MRSESRPLAGTCSVPGSELVLSHGSKGRATAEKRPRGARVHASRSDGPAGGNGPAEKRRRRVSMRGSEQERENSGAVYAAYHRRLGGSPIARCVWTTPTSCDKRAPLPESGKSHPVEQQPLPRAAEPAGPAWEQVQETETPLPAGASTGMAGGVAPHAQLFDEAVPRLGTCPRGVARTSHPRDSMLMAALLVVAKTYLRAAWDRIGTWWHVQQREPATAGMDKPSPPVPTGANLENKVAVNSNKALR